jgi:hypothetical protein
MKASDLLKLIPNIVRVTRNVSYEVLWNDEFPKDDNQLGECRGDVKQIVINKNQSPTETFKTYLHEALHAADFEEEIGLTEGQVRKLEDSLFRMAKLNGILDKLLK